MSRRHAQRQSLAEALEAARGEFERERIVKIREVCECAALSHPLIAPHMVEFLIDVLDQLLPRQLP